MNFMMSTASSIFTILILISTVGASNVVSSTRRVADLCRHNSDCNNGICVAVPNIRGEETRICRCHPNHDGDFCEFKKCPTNPCYNDGICEWLNGAFKCHCPIGYEGGHCEVKITQNACDSNPCVNGICRLDGSLDNAVCDCFYYFTGPRCDQPTPCDWSTCSGHGTCSPINGTPHCTCESGWTGDRCELDLNECAVTNSVKSLCGKGVCENTPGSYVCHCPSNLIGAHCEIPYDNGCHSNPCLNKGICKSGYNASTHRSFSCHCALGFMGDLCEARINECAAVEDAITGNWYTPCDNGGACINGIGEHTCRCMPGHTGPACDDSVNECELFGAGVCQNGGTCLDNYNGFECACVIGFTGDRCEASVDDCKNNLCHPESTCIDGLRRYDCKCPSHRMGIHCQFLNPCTVDTPCQHGDCFPLTHLGTYKCKCQSGYTGPNCTEDIDECAVDSHLCYRGTCVNLAGSFRCDCDLGFEGKYCEKRTDECNPQPCLNGGTCIDGTADFECICMPAWTGKLCDEPRPYSPACSYHYCFHGGVCQRSPLGIESCVCPPRFEGDKCEMLRPDPCSVNICQNNGICVPTNDMKSFTCSCTPGFAGAFCQQRAASCDVQPCVHGTCLITSDDTLFKCSCDNGFFGSRCERQQTQCDSTESSCGSGLCLDTSQGATCVCPSTHVGAACEIPVTNPCQLSPCLNDGVCLQTDIRGNFQCTCPSGFSGHICQFGSKKCSTASCLHGGVCDAYGGCSCAPGYGGQHCERELNRCAREFCQNGGTCENVDETGFACHCAYGFAGTHCELKFDVDKFNESEHNETKLCHKHNCGILSGNGVCDQLCNLPGCNFDGGDCSSNVSRPLAVCPYEKYCKYVLNNGKCDELCNNEACLFDGFDCVARSNAACPNATFCQKHYGDGTCDLTCNVPGCGWDGGDCSHRGDAKKYLDDSLKLILITEVETFIEHTAPRFLMVLSRSLRAAARFRLDDHGHPMIYHWSEKAGQGERLVLPKGMPLDVSDRRRRRQTTTDRSGVVVYVVLDLSVCHTLSNLLHELPIQAFSAGTGREYCFSNGTAAANLVAMKAHQGIFDDIGIQIIGTEAVVMPKKTEETSNWSLKNVIIVIGLITLGFLIIGTAFRGGVKRKIMYVRNISYPPRHNEPPRQRQQNVGYPTYYNGAIPLMGDISGCASSIASSNRGSFHSEGPAAKRAAYIPEPLGIAELSKPRPQRFFTKLHELAANEAPLPMLTTDLASCATILDADGQTCIHCTVDSVSTKMENDIIADIEKLIAAGADVTAQDDKGQNALHKAIERQREHVALYLLPKMNVNVSDEHGCTALYLAVSTNLRSVINAILSQEGVDVNALAYVNFTPLTKCARIGDQMLPVVEQLLAYPGIDVNRVGDKMDLEFSGMTALHEAAACNSVAILRFLVRKKANICPLDVKSRTPLYCAVENKGLESVIFLLDHMAEASIMTATDEDETPLLLAMSRGYDDIAARIKAKLPQQMDTNVYWQPMPMPMPIMPTLPMPIEQPVNVGKSVRGTKRNAMNQPRHSFKESPPPPSTSSCTSGPCPIVYGYPPMPSSHSPQTNPDSAYGTPSPNETAFSGHHSSTNASTVSNGSSDTSSFASSPEWHLSGGNTMCGNGVSPDYSTSASSTTLVAAPYVSEHQQMPQMCQPAPHPMNRISSQYAMPQSTMGNPRLAHSERNLYQASIDAGCSYPMHPSNPMLYHPMPQGFSHQHAAANAEAQQYFYNQQLLAASQPPFWFQMPHQMHGPNGKQLPQYPPTLGAAQTQ